MYYVGVDGCKAGWLAVEIASNYEWKAEVFPDIYALWERYKNASLILIDIPIGLKEGGPEERQCDIIARKSLKPKGSSVFRVPCRSAIYKKTYEEASSENYRLTGKKLPKQTWSIIPKIKEVDILLSKDSKARSLIREIHPELCFWALANQQPIKSKKNKLKGFHERLTVLSNYFSPSEKIVAYCLNNYLRKDVARDDILDALCAAVTAALGAGCLSSIPEAPEFDKRGLRMEMVFFTE